MASQVEVAAGHATAAQGHSDAAAVSATASSNSAYASDLSAQAAAASATAAAGSADAASAQASAAANSAYAADLSASNAASSAADAAASATASAASAALSGSHATDAADAAQVAQDAANALTNFIDSVPKESVYAATTGNVTLSGTQTIDGTTPPNGSRILVLAQTNAAENGIYVYSTSGAWTRATDFDEAAEVVPGITVFVVNGTTQAETKWMMITPLPITLGTTAIEWTFIGSTGAVQAGTNLVKTGTTISFQALPEAQVLIGNASSVATARTISGAFTLSSSGLATLANSIVSNANISAGAGIVDSKLATITSAGKVANSATTATANNTASTIVARDTNGNFTAGTITAALTGNASTSTKLATARTISISGDGTGSTTFDGSANVSLALTLGASGVTAGTYNSVTVNAKGLVTAATVDNSRAPIVSPTFTGTPAAPTPAVSTNTTQLATTAYVVSRIAQDAPTKTGTGASGTWGISITGAAAAVPFSGVTSRPTTLAGYGITDALTIYSTTTTSTSKTLANRERCTVLASGLTITLPANPSPGWEVSVTIAGTIVDTVIARNGANIMSAAEDLRVDIPDVTVTLYFVDATRGWRII